MADSKPAKGKLTSRDWDSAAEFIADQYSTRKVNRKDLEAQWREVDRQVAMKPDPPNTKSGRPARGTEWMGWLELPLQPQTLETLTADVRRLLFPEDRPWFDAYANAPDDWLDESLQNLDDLIIGSKVGAPDKLTQSDVNDLVAAAQLTIQDAYRFRDMLDSGLTHAFKYGQMILRRRVVTQEDFTHEASGVISRKQKFPALIPYSPWNVYLDDSLSALQFGNMVIKPAPIFQYRRKLGDLRRSAKMGGGGWIASQIKKLEGEDKEEPVFLEYEGDAIIPRSTRDNLFLPNVILTVCLGKDSTGAKGKVVRYQENPFPYASWMTADYHRDDADSAYASSPLIKGMPIQKAATDVFNRIVHAAQLNTEPPIKYDSANPLFAIQGGPVIAPRELWAGLANVEAVKIGDPTALMEVFLRLVEMHQTVTGVTAPRLGGQTKSHQTAFAVDAELSRGANRTVDFVNHLKQGPLKAWLSQEWDLIRKHTAGGLLVFVPQWKTYVNLRKQFMPKEVSYTIQGVENPLDRQQKEQTRQTVIAAIGNLAQVLEAKGVNLNWERITRVFLNMGWPNETDDFFENVPESAAGAPANTPGLPAGP